MNSLSVDNIYKSLPPITSASDVWALDLELSGLRESQLHRPEGRMTSLTGTCDGKDVYIIFEESEVKGFLDRISLSTWVFHNSTFDLSHLRRWATILERKNMRDTMLVEKVMFSDYYDDFGLNDLVRRYLKCYMPKDVRKEFHNLEGAMTEEQIKYAALDVIGTFLVDKEQQKILEQKDRLIWERIDLPTVWTSIDLSGFTVDVDKWYDIAERNQEIVDRIEYDLGQKYGKNVTKTKYAKRAPASPKVRYELETGEELPAPPDEEAKYQKKWEEYLASKIEVSEFVPFNPASPSQVLALLKSQGLDIDSTGDDIIAPYREASDTVSSILEYRGAAKKVSTYGKSYMKFVENDGRIYPSLNVIGASSGRNCVAGGTILSTDLGDVPISELDLAGDVSYNICTHLGNWKRIKEKFYKGKEEMFLVTLENGSQIKCTAGHRFLTNNGWKCLYEIKSEDRIITSPLPS